MPRRQALSVAAALLLKTLTPSATGLQGAPAALPEENCRICTAGDFCACFMSKLME